eukprot:9443148-Pyramimonas_sp.AAC.1
MRQRVEGPQQALHRSRVGAAVLLTPGRGTAGGPATGPGRPLGGIHGAPAERGRGGKGGSGSGGRPWRWLAEQMLGPACAKERRAASRRGGGSSEGQPR